MKRLDGKVALITGGNTGIGRGVALTYADEGADVAIAWIAREDEVAPLEASITAKGRRFLAVRTDVTREPDVTTLVDTVVSRFGRIDILVNNAGIQKAQAITETTLDDWERMMAVHLRGAFLCCRAVAPHGVLVNSIAPGLIDTGFDPLPDDVKRAHAASLPLKRLGLPDDLVGAFVFLASDESRYFCGQTLHPNGGEIMPWPGAERGGGGRERRGV